MLLSNSYDLLILCKIEISSKLLVAFAKGSVFLSPKSPVCTNKRLK